MSSKLTSSHIKINLKRRVIYKLSYGLILNLVPQKIKLETPLRLKKLWNSVLAFFGQD